MTNKMI